MASRFETNEKRAKETGSVETHYMGSIFGQLSVIAPKGFCVVGRQHWKVF